MKHAGRTVLLCTCERTMDLDSARICKALGADDAGTIHDHLCRTQVDRFADALKADEPVLVACTQEAPLFRELAEEAGLDPGLAFVNIRERAGWTRAKGDLAPKIAALLAESAIAVEPAGRTVLKSDGVCLVYGKGQAAFDVARRLSTRLSVTLLLQAAEDLIPPSVVDMAIYKGTVVAASGHLGAFEITVDGYAPMVPSSKDAMQFMMARDGAASQCSLIFDMTGADPLFPSHERREGYFRVDPNHAAGVAESMFEISDLVGEFEKPLYVRYDAEICAHGRSRKIGCTRCLDVCPASAIRSGGDTVEIDHALCGGCGACSSVCPSGAVSYTYPRREDVIARAQTLISTFLKAGGKAPVLLVHDNAQGTELIGALARYGSGLPVNVLPFAVNEVTSAGHDLFAAVLAAGAAHVVLVCDPRREDELTGLRGQSELMNAFLAGIGHDGVRLHLFTEPDPDRLGAFLESVPKVPETAPQIFTAVGDKRTIARTAFLKLNEAAPEPQERIALPEGSPYGRITVSTDGCTLCLSCAGACPMGAILTNPDRPQISFVEQACVQCGLCRTTCPESVIMLEPGLNLSSDAMSPVILHEEEPFECIRCGKPFGTRATIERISAQLAGKHAMFMDGDAADLIRMCDTCRIEQQAMSGDDPFKAGERPRIRTTQDYLEEEERVRAGGRRTALTADDFLADED